MQGIQRNGPSRVLNATKSTAQVQSEERSLTHVFMRTRNPPGVLVTSCSQVLNQPYAVAQEWLNRQMDGVDKLLYLCAVFRLKIGLDPTEEIITMWARGLGVDPHVVQEWFEEQESHCRIEMSSLKQGLAAQPPTAVISPSHITHRVEDLRSYTPS